MTKNIIKIIFIFLISFYQEISEANIKIIATVDGDIITNFDVKKESDYLKILNPNLSQLENKKILELAKNSLINEIKIDKKKEIEK